MPSKQPKPMQTPFQNQQQQVNTFGTQSIARTPEAQSYLDTPLDFGDETDVDPGVGRRTDLAEEDAAGRWDSAFMSGVPSYIRQASRAKELRDIRGQGAYEAQQARFMNQQGNNARRTALTMADLGRRERLLPQIVQTGGSGSASGFGTQIVQPEQSFWHKAGLTAIGGATSAARMFTG